MEQLRIDSIIKERLDFCKEKVVPLIETKPEEITGVKLTRKEFEEYLIALGQFSMHQAESVERKILAVYDHYQGRVEGIQMVHRLLDLTKAKKIPSQLVYDEVEYDSTPAVFEYSCGACGHNDIFDDHKYCPYCGVEFLEDKNE